MQEIVKRLINLRWLHISVSSNSYCCFPSDVVVAVEVVSVLLEDWTDLLLWTVTMVRVCWWSRTPSVEEVLSEVTTLLWIDWLLWTEPLICVRWPTRMVLLWSSPPSFVLWMLKVCQPYERECQHRIFQKITKAASYQRIQQICNPFNCLLFHLQNI